MDSVPTSSSLTNSQLLIWTGQKLDPKSPLYNVIFSFELDGPVNSKIFQESFSKLVQSSEALRSIFIEEDEFPIQKVLSSIPIELPIFDLSEKEDTEEALNSFLHEKNNTQFDLSERLLYSALIKISADKWVWYLNIHHIITDAWSFSLLYSAMADLYSAAVNNRPEPEITFPPFSEYRSFETTNQDNDEHRKIREYWAGKVAAPISPTGFYGFNGDSTTESERIYVDLGEKRTKLLRQLAQENDIRAFTENSALFNVFATVLYSLLSKITNQTEFLVGSPAHNRINLDFKQTPGLFIEFFPLYAKVEPSETFSSLLKKLRLETMDFLRHAQPGAATPSISNSFQVVLNYIHTSFPDFAGIPMNSKWVNPGHTDAGHHFRLQIHDFDNTGNLHLCFDLNNSVFTTRQQQKIQNHFLILLDAFIKDRSQEIGTIPLNEKPILAPDTPVFRDIITQFQQQAAGIPTLTAIQFEQEKITYSAVQKKVNQLAAGLQQLGISKGDRVVIHYKRGPEFVVAVLAVLTIGAAYIPVPFNTPIHRLKKIIKDSEATLAITNISGNQFSKTVAELLEIGRDKKVLHPLVNPGSPAYIMYTSGSTGEPKGVVISRKALASYLNWAADFYVSQSPVHAPLFTSVGFDLTVTSLFLPLITGGTSFIFPENEHSPGLELLDVLQHKEINFIKLTPSHLTLVKGKSYTNSSLRTMIIGGEELKTSLAVSTQRAFGEQLVIYNEYGPTEATVGSVVHRYNFQKDIDMAVPIGTSIATMAHYILDDHLNQVPDGVVGQLYLKGAGLANEYWADPERTAQQFLPDPFLSNERMYKTGDLARLRSDGILEYHGRVDEQVKINGFRIELGEVEHAMTQLNSITQSIAAVWDNDKRNAFENLTYCEQCGIPSNYPDATFDSEGVCNLCVEFESYQQKAERYFKSMEALKERLISKRDTSGEYDCMMLLSGGKDSSYALARLKELGLKILAFNLDNGYISEQAKNNVKSICEALDVDYHFATTKAMNAIFVDSLERHSNVCNGCFKTIYTLSTKLALKKKIPFIVTGLSRGQFFETRLTEELFRDESRGSADIDEVILNARKQYHRVQDAVCTQLDVSMFQDDAVFEQVEFVDFYRYCDASLEDMYEFLSEKTSWSRPTDTGRSTNCLINQVGIYVHKKKEGYSNYAFPYSWDVRIGHKTRTESIEEINEEIDEREVLKIMKEIGYDPAQMEQEAVRGLVAYYTGPERVSNAVLRKELGKRIPAHSIPSKFIYVEDFPLTENGKVDKAALPDPNGERPEIETVLVQPRNEIEKLIADIWKEVMQINEVGVLDNFLELGGTSLAAIRIMSRVNERIRLDLPLRLVFEQPTIEKFSAEIEREIIQRMEAQSS